MSFSGTAEATLSNYEQVLKVFYLPAIQEQLNHATILADLIETNEKDVSGKTATIECHYGRTTGTGVRADGAALPDSAYQKYKTATVPMRYNYGRVAFTGPTIAATKTEKGSYARVIDSEITGVVNDLQREINRQLWGCGYGICARWRSGVSASDLGLQKKYRGNTAGVDQFGSTFGAKYFDENTQIVAAKPSSDSSSNFAVLVVGTTDLVAGTITPATMSTGYDTVSLTTDPGTPAAGTWFCRKGAARSFNKSTAATTGAGYIRQEMMGLRGIITDTNLGDIACTDGTSTGFTIADPLQGLTTVTYAWWKSKVYTATGTRYAAQRALTYKNMQMAFDFVEIKAGKDYGPDLILTSHALRREYYDLCIADRRAVNTMTLDGGWKALEFNGIPLTVDQDAIDGEMYFITTKDLQIYRMSDYEWMTKDGSVLHRVADYDAYEAVLFRYAELGCTRRNSHAVLADLAYEYDY